MINLLFCGNDGVFDGVMTCLLSILKRSAPDTYHVHIFTMTLTRIKPNYTAISPVSIERLKQMLQSYNPENKVIIHDVTDLYESQFKGCPNEGAYGSPYTLIRLFADQVKDMPDRILYLDTDIMFNRDIHLLYNQVISQVEYAAARDHYGKYLIHPHYINAGVLYFNMDKCRQTNLFGKAREWIQKKKLMFADQSAIIRSTTKKKLLPQRFNDQKFLHKHTVVRHFSKRLFYLPYPHTENIKQYMIDKVHEKFHYDQFDDIYEEYHRWKGVSHD